MRKVTFMRRFMVIGMVLPGGCAGIGEMREEAPFATFTSDKTPDALAACISEAWTMQDRWPITPDVRINPIAGGKQVLIYNSQTMAPDAFADITAEGSMTKINYYAKHRKAYKQTFADLTRGCI